MTKERLEEIKRQLEESNSYDDNPNGYWYHNIKWLIEQAERVHGRNHLMGLEGMYADCNRTVADLTSENKRYREALKFYAKGKHVSYCLYGDSNNDLVNDYGDVARKALESESDE